MPSNANHEDTPVNILLVSSDNSSPQHLKTTNIIGGKHIHQALLERGWTEAGHTVVCAFPKDVKKSFWYKVVNKLKRTFVKPDQFTQHRKYIMSIQNSLERNTRAALASRSVDVISVQDVLAANAVRRALAGLKPVPVVQTLHGYFAREIINYSGFESSSKNEIYEYLFEFEKNAISFVNAVVSVDTRIRNYVVDTFERKPSRLEVIFNAIDDSKFHPPADRSELLAIRREIGLPHDKRIVLVARRLVKKNGVRYAVEAFDILCNANAYDAAHLLIVGDGPESDDIAALIRDRGLERHVTLAGVVPHGAINRYYASCDVVLLPSTRSDDIEEATSLTMLEGMISGKVVIASAIGGLKEVIRHNENGILVDDKSPDQIARAIMTVLENQSEYERIARTAYEYAKHNHGYREHAKKFADLFDTLVRAANA